MNGTVRSDAILSEGLFGLGAVGEFEGVADLVVEPLDVLEHVGEASHSRAADLHVVLDAVVAAVNRPHAAQRARVEAVLDALRAEGHALRDASECAGVADGRADSPAAVAALQLGKTAGLHGCPLVDAAGHLAGALRAAQAGENLVHGVHPKDQQNYIEGSPCKLKHTKIFSPHKTSQTPPSLTDSPILTEEWYCRA